MYKDDIKLFEKNEKELGTFSEAVVIYSQDTGMGFDIGKWAIQIIKGGKRHMAEEIELPNQEKSECSEKREPTDTWEYRGTAL